MSLVLDGSLGVTFPASNTPSFTNYQGGALTSGTAQASTSGTSIDFTSIPSWVKRITVSFKNCGTSSTSPKLIQVGNGSVITTGYLGSSDNEGVSAAFTTGFGINSVVSANRFQGLVTMVLEDATTNTWVSSGVVSCSDTPRTITTAGYISLSSVLDRVRITTVNGTDTFAAGSINILYE